MFYNHEKVIDMSKTFLGIHLVIGTKGRMQTITPEHRRLIYAYFHKVLTDRNCKTIRINGMADHIHLAFNMHPSVALSTMVRDMKSESSRWITNEGHFPHFMGWSKGYYAASFSYEEREAIAEYIKGQETHHSGYGYLQEIQGLVSRTGLTWHDDDFNL